VWEALHTGGQGQTIAGDVARFEFTQDGAVIKWKMDRQRRSLYWEASGTVTKIDDSPAELVGKHAATNADSRRVRVTGSSLRYSLTRHEATMQGPAFGAAGSTFSVTLKKTK
jgi:hypothetical protein